MKKIGSAKMAKHDANRYIFVPVMTDEVKWREPIKPHVWRAMIRAILNRRLAYTSLSKPTANEWKVWIEEV